MKKSELKEIIKASFLAEAEDSKKGNKEEQKRMEGAIRDDRDHIKDLEKDIKDNEEKLAKLKKDFKDDVSEEMKKDDVDEAMRGDDMDEMMRGDDLDEAVEDDVNVDVEDEENIDVDVEKDVDVDDVSKESDIEVKSEIPGESSDVSAILGLLTKAQERAEGMGDEKLLDQIGNTITYYTRTHVVKSTNEGKEDLDEKVELDESLARFAKLAGLK